MEKKIQLEVGKRYATEIAGFQALILHKLKCKYRFIGIITSNRTGVESVQLYTIDGKAISERRLTPLFLDYDLTGELPCPVIEEYKEPKSAMMKIETIKELEEAVNKRNELHEAITEFHERVEMLERSVSTFEESIDNTIQNGLIENNTNCCKGTGVDCFCMDGKQRD